MYLIDPGGLKEVALIFPENSGGKKTSNNRRNWQKNPQTIDKKPQTIDKKTSNYRQKTSN